MIEQKTYIQNNNEKKMKKRECKKILWNPSNTKVKKKEKKQVAGDTKTKQLNTTGQNSNRRETAQSEQYGRSSGLPLWTLCVW